MTTRLTDQELTAIIKGCEGVTPGPWVLHYEIDGPETQTRIKANGKALATTAPRCGRPHWQHEAVANAAHIARLDPDAVRAMATELQQRRAGDSAIIEVCAKVAEDHMLHDDVGDPDDDAYNLAVSNIAFAIRALAPPAPAAAAAATTALTDTDLLNAIRDESWDLRCFDMPTGGDDAEIGWHVIGHWMAAPHERVVGTAYRDEPRDAVRAAILAAQAGGAS